MDESNLQETFKQRSHRRMRPRELLRAAGHILHRIRGFFPITSSGVVFLCLAYLVWFGEVSRHQNQILFASILWFLAAFSLIFAVEIVGVILVAILTMRANRGGLSQGTLETKQELDSGYRVFRPFWIPFIEVRVSVEAAPFEARYNKRGHWIEERIRVASRGRYESVSHLITVRDVFGITSFSFPHTSSFVAEIKPASCHFESIQLAARTSGEGYSFPAGEAKGELVEMRRYQAGDPLRYILWRVFARSRKLLVRAPEPAVVEEREMFVYFVSGIDDEPSASLTRTFLASFADARSELYFCADGTDRVSTDIVDALDDVIESARHREHGGESMEAQARYVPAQALNHSFIMVPPTMGAWYENVRIFCINRNVRPTFVMAFEASEVSHKKPSALRKVFCSETAVELHTESRQALCDRLSELGDVELVDVKTGAIQTYVPTVQTARRSSKRGLPSGGEV